MHNKTGQCLNDILGVYNNYRNDFDETQFIKLLSISVELLKLRDIKPNEHLKDVEIEKYPTITNFFETQ